MFVGQMYFPKLNSSNTTSVSLPAINPTVAENIPEINARQDVLDIQNLLASVQSDQEVLLRSETVDKPQVKNLSELVAELNEKIENLKINLYLMEFQERKLTYEMALLQNTETKKDKNFLKLCAEEFETAKKDLEEIIYCPDPELEEEKEN